MFRIKSTCADCRDDTLDKTSGCADTDCSGGCIECLRMAGGCHCTCKDIAFSVCPTFTTITNCACSDGTVETHNILTGCWVGFVISDDLKANLIALAARLCPDDGDPHFVLELYGSTYSFGSHTTTTSLDCPKDVSGWTLIPVAALVPNFQGAAITHGGDGGACDGGAFFLSVHDLGIILKDPPAGAPDGSVSCSQEGGCVALMMRISASCGKQIALCPFTGAAGADFECNFIEECEDWDEEFPQTAGCDLTFTFTHRSGTCTLTETVTFGSDAAIVLDPAMGSPQHFVKTVPGCTGDGTTPYIVRVQKVWDAGCVHNCAVHNSDVSTTYNL